MSQGAIDKAKMFLAKYRTPKSSVTEAKKSSGSDSSDSDNVFKKARAARIRSAPSRATDGKTKALLERARALSGTRASSTRSQVAAKPVKGDSFSDVDISEISDGDIQFSDDSDPPGFAWAA